MLPTASDIAATGVRGTGDPATRYEPAFAAYYDRYYTGWTDRFTPGLLDLLDRGSTSSHASGVRALDLGCGTGKVALEMADRGWEVIGLDISPAMLDIARQRAADRHATTGAVSFLHGDCSSFSVRDPVDVVTALEAPINHVLSPDAVQMCFRSVASSLRPGGRFVFDLYEPAHFSYWTSVVVFEDDSSLMVKRGVWDPMARRGTRQLSGAIDTASGCLRLHQLLHSQAYASSDVDNWLAAADLERVPTALPVPVCGCGKPDPSPCRTVYTAVRR